MLCGNTTCERTFLATVKFVLCANKVRNDATCISTDWTFTCFTSMCFVHCRAYLQIMEPGFPRHWPIMLFQTARWAVLLNVNKLVLLLQSHTSAYVLRCCCKLYQVTRLFLEIFENAEIQGVIFLQTVVSFVSVPHLFTLYRWVCSILSFQSAFQYKLNTCRFYLKLQFYLKFRLLTTFQTELMNE